MAVLSLRFTDEEYRALKIYAKTNGVTLNKAVKDAFFEMLEDRFDLECFDKAYAAYRKDGKAYTIDEVEKELEIAG